tara:strand:- start:624 stop:4649 length:4026 start_codon:yes stop_codon:yes gene_type:complete
MDEEYDLRKEAAQPILQRIEADKQQDQVTTPQETQINAVVEQNENNAPIKEPEAITPEVVPEQSAYNKKFNESILATTPLAIPTAVGLGVVDFGVDVITKLTGQEQLDDKYDRVTKFDNPWAQRLRNFASVAIPTFIPVVGWAKYVNALRLPALTSAMAHIGGAAAIDAAVIGFSDMGEEDNTARVLADSFPQTFGPQGNLPIPEDWKVLDGDSAAVRRQKNMLESTILSGTADLLGYAVAGMKPALHWFKPASDKAKNFKKAVEMQEADPESIKALASLMARRKTAKNLTKQDRRILDQQISNLKKQLRTTGYSEATTVPAEAYVKKQQDGRLKQIDEVAQSKLTQEAPPIPGQPRDYDPWINAGLANKAETAVSSVPPAAAARNAFETSVIKEGLAVGDAPSTLTDNMLRDGIGLKKLHREIVRAIADASEAAGDYIGKVGMIRRSKEQMNDSAWKIYKDIINPLTDLRVLFKDDKSLLSLGKGKLPVEYISEDAARASAFALRDLTRLYLGKEVTESSARMMDTLGREVATQSSASMVYKDLIDEDRIKEVILDKMEFLSAEYGLNKYISGWQLQNKKWWSKSTKPIDPIATKAEFDAVRAKRIEDFQKLRINLELLEEQEPFAMRPLIEAFAYSDGDVVSLMDLYKWADREISPLGLLKSTSPDKMNVFARGAWSVVYNNTLSGLSGLRAAVGNGSAIILKSMTSILGHGIESVIKRDIEPLRRSLYLHSGVLETTRRAMGDAAKRMKMVHNDPEFMMKAIREDFKVADDETWAVLDDMNELWKRDGNLGKQYLYGWARANKEISRMRWMRTGTTFMSGIDAGTDSYIATMMARTNSYSEIIESKGGFSVVGDTLNKELADAEVANYKALRDKDGIIKDEFARNQSGEIALNLTDDTSNWINKATTAVPALKNFFMFPRTGINFFKMSLSYTPLAVIPNLNKYSKILLAGDDIKKIKLALAEHGIENFENTPNFMQYYRNLRNEYRGRLALSGMTAISLYNYAMGGNIRGNGPVNGSERSKLRDKGWRPKTIKIGGNWVNYDGIPMVDTILTLIGDLSYYQNDLGSELTHDFIDKLTWSISATYLNNTPLYGLEPFQAAMAGDQSAWTRITANLVRGAIPLSGAMGVVSNAISTSQKDIYNDLIGYVTNRVPVANLALPERIDYWTGQPINDIDNPLLRTLNAISPVKVSGGEEPWRQWLLDTGFDGMGIIKTTSSGRQELDANMREKLARYIGEQQLWRQVEEMRTNPYFNEEMEKLRMFRRKGMSYDDVRVEAKMTQTYQVLDKMLRNAKKIAEARLMAEHPQIKIDVENQLTVDSLVKKNRLSEAEDFMNFHRK